MSQIQTLETPEIPCVKISTLADYVSKTPLAILGSPQNGKTNLAKHIVESLSLKPNISIRVIDSSTQWLFNSPCSVVATFEPPTMTMYDFDNEVFGYGHKFSDKVLLKYLSHRNIVFDFSECDNLVYERTLQSRLIYLDKKRLIKEVKENQGEIINRVVYVYEECQGVLGSNSLRRNNLSFLAKAISVGANYGLSLLVVTRRASEVSTQVFEHTTVKCVTNSNQPNCLRKLRTIFSKEHVNQIKTLGLGEFLILMPKGVYRLQTTVYRGNTAKQIVPKYIKRKSLKEKLRGWLNK